MSMLRKGQMHWVVKWNITRQISFIASMFGLVAEVEQETRLHVHPLPS